MTNPEPERLLRDMPRQYTLPPARLPCGQLQPVDKRLGFAGNVGVDPKVLCPFHRVLEPMTQQQLEALAPIAGWPVTRPDSINARFDDDQSPLRPEEIHE